MDSQDKPLRKLPGLGRKTFGVVSTTSTRLYLEDDHLLYVANDRFTESYKRFYFREIQALLLCRTTSGRIVNLVLGGGAGFFAALGLLGDLSWNWGGAGLWVCGSVASFFLLLLIINAARGPTCVSHLQTAVHTEELPSLNRVRTARKAFHLLRPEIAAAQENLASTEAQAGVQEQPVTAPAPVVPRRVSKVAPSVVRHEPGRFHEIVAYVLLVDSMATGLDIFFDLLWLTVLTSFLGMALLGATVLALVRQHASDLGQRIRSVMWVALGYQGLMFVFGFIFTVYLTVTHEVQGDNQWELVRLWSQQSALESPPLLSALTFSTVVSLVLGLEGIASVREHRRITKAPPPLVPPAATPEETA